MYQKKDVLKMYREHNGSSYTIIFNDVVKRFQYKDYQYNKPVKDYYLPCTTIPYAEALNGILYYSEYMADVIVISECDQYGNYRKIDYIVIHVTNKAYILEQYIIDIIAELSNNNYGIQVLPMIRLSYHKAAVSNSISS